MPLFTFICEHCGEEVNLFLRASQIGEPVSCPHCQQIITNLGTEEAGAAPPPHGKGPT